MSDPEPPARQSIAIDMDEVLADALSRHLDLYNRHYQTALTRDKVHGKYLHQVVPEEHQPQVHQWVRDVGFFRDLPVMADCVAVVRELQQHYDIFIATAAMQFPNSFIEKYDWLAMHFPFIPWTHIVFCGDKSIIAADYLIDDHAQNFRRFRGEGILFTASHNVGVTGYRRVDTWREVHALFLGDRPFAA